MFGHLQIYDRRERWMVGLADAALAVAVAAARPFGRRSPGRTPPRRILLLRLERIGDLLMAAPAIAEVRRLAPDARLDLVVGSWNEPIARMLGLVDRVDTLDVRWLARGASAPGAAELVRRAWRWRAERYDLAINFEGDIRSHLLMALSGAPRRVGFDMAGGGSLVTDRVPYDPSAHVSDNLMRLAGVALGGTRAPDATASAPSARRDRRLVVPASARERAAALLGDRDPDPSRAADRSCPVIGVHVSAGRRIKQWEPARFGDLSARLAAKYSARLVFTGSDEDRDLVQAAIERIPRDADVVNLCGRADLVTLAALLERFAVFVTCDSGPMHLAAEVGTPVVAIFGPSDPGRWGPRTSRARVVHAAVDCRPCNRIRRPPARCVGHVPDCLAAVTVDDVIGAVDEMMDSRGRTVPAAERREASEAGDGVR